MEYKYIYIYIHDNSLWNMQQKLWVIWVISWKFPLRIPFLKGGAPGTYSLQVWDRHPQEIEEWEDEPGNVAPPFTRFLFLSNLKAPVPTKWLIHKCSWKRLNSGGAFKRPEKQCSIAIVNLTSLFHKIATYQHIWYHWHRFLSACHRAVFCKACRLRFWVSRSHCRTGVVSTQK